MLAEERQSKIYEMICESDAVSTTTLVKTFGVSIETIRRDLLEMENKKLIKRVHGGAVKAGAMRPFADLVQRHRTHETEKASIAKLALMTVKEGDVIAIDSGSTAVFFAEALKESYISITVVTHSIDVFEILKNNKNIETILCAGHYMRSENAFYGIFAIDMLNRIHVDKCFICPSAISLDFEICDYTHELCAMQQKIMAISDNVYILADSSKFEKRALIKLGETAHEYTYITDSGLKEETKNLYLENGINILTGN